MSDALYPPGSYGSGGGSGPYWDQQGAGYEGYSPRTAARSGHHQGTSQTLPRNQYANTQTLYSPYFQGGSPSAAAGISGSATASVVIPSSASSGLEAAADGSLQRDYGGCYPSDYGLPLEPLAEDNCGEMMASPHQPSSAMAAAFSNTRYGHQTQWFIFAFTQAKCRPRQITNFFILEKVLNSTYLSIA